MQNTGEDLWSPCYSFSQHCLSLIQMYSISVGVVLYSWFISHHAISWNSISYCPYVLCTPVPAVGSWSISQARWDMWPLHRNFWSVARYICVGRCPGGVPEHQARQSVDNTIHVCYCIYWIFTQSSRTPGLEHIALCKSLKFNPSLDVWILIHHTIGESSDRSQIHSTWQRAQTNSTEPGSQHRPVSGRSHGKTHDNETACGDSHIPPAMYSQKTVTKMQNEMLKKEWSRICWTESEHLRVCFLDF